MKTEKKDTKKDDNSGLKDKAKVAAADHIKITDVESGKEIVNKRG